MDQKAIYVTKFTPNLSNLLMQSKMGILDNPNLQD